MLNSTLWHNRDYEPVRDSPYVRCVLLGNQGSGALDGGRVSADVHGISLGADGGGDCGEGYAGDAGADLSCLGGADAGGREGKTAALRAQRQRSGGRNADGGGVPDLDGRQPRDADRGGGSHQSQQGF